MSAGNELVTTSAARVQMRQVGDYMVASITFSGDVEAIVLATLRMQVIHLDEQAWEDFRTLIRSHLQRTLSRATGAPVTTTEEAPTPSAVNAPSTETPQ